jgi:hypothetical protein
LNWESHFGHRAAEMADADLALSEGPTRRRPDARGDGTLKRAYDSVFKDRGSGDAPNCGGDTLGVRPESVKSFWSIFISTVCSVARLLCRGPTGPESS